jgi:hypothetical protein
VVGQGIPCDANDIGLREKNIGIFLRKISFTGIFFNNR